MSDLKITKPAGWDWEVTYQWADDTPDTMLVFGQVRIEDAIREARFSLEIGGSDYAILEVKRKQA